MLLLAADEDFDWDILRGLRRRLEAVDIVTVRESGMSGSDDPAILEWAARAGRVLLSHDVNTMTRHAIDRMAEGLACPGVMLVLRNAVIRQVIEDISLAVECCDASELEGHTFPCVEQRSVRSRTHPKRTTEKVERQSCHSTISV